MANNSLLLPPETNDLPKTVLTRNTMAWTELVEGVAHELNDKVAIVLGNVQLIKLRNRDGAVIEGLNRIEKSIIKCSDLVKAIQHYAGSNYAGTGKAVNFADALVTSLEFDETSWREDAIEKNLTIITKIVADNSYVVADMQDLVSAISHLIHNAVDVSPHNSIIEIDLSVQNELSFLTIMDRGCGIAEEIKTKVFEPFFSTKKSKGSGLGLTIVQSIVSRYGGRIGFSDNVDQGTVFTISFPSKLTGTELNEENKSNDSSGVRRILIVDDDIEIRNVLSEMLQIEGFSAEHCADAYSAMELLEKGKFDMVITDLGMPGMSGYDLAEYIHDKYKNIQIVLLTGWGSSIQKGERELKGVKAVLSKPFRLGQILSLVRK